MLYLIADTHSNVERAEKLMSKAEEKYDTVLGSDDIVIILGDALGTQKKNIKSQYDKIAIDNDMIEWCANQPFSILSIRGNHDTSTRINMLGGYRTCWHNQEVTALGTNLFYLDDGAIYSIPINSRRAAKVLALGGAVGHDAGRQGTPCKFQQAFTRKYMGLIYADERMEANLVLSHDCPSSKMSIFKPLFGTTTANEILEQVMQKVDFGAWYFGHHHFDLTTAKNFRCIYNDVVRIDVRPHIYKSRSTPS